MEVLNFAVEIESANSRGFYGGVFRPDHPEPWLLLHVKSRQEKALCGDLTALDIDHYLPMTAENRTHAGRKVVIEVPVFPGYLFLRAAMEDAYRADRTRRVAKVISVSDQAALNENLWNLHLAIENRVPLTAHAWIQKGVKVEIIDGPLKGLRGLVADRRSLGEVILEIRMLGSAVCISVESDWVAPLD